MDKEIEALKLVLKYDPNTGNFYWLKTVNSNAIKGQLAGYNPEFNYRILWYNNKKYRQHILAFLFMTGKFPTKQIDHKNRIKSDNRWDNLREVTQSQNTINSIKYKKNATSKHKGVDFDRNKYRARIYKDGKSINLGRYDTEEEAAIVYNNKAKELFGNYASLNNI